MKKLTDIKGVIFDYGGTIDTNGAHWAEVLWERYVAFEVPVTKEQFKEAYVHGERTLALTPLITPEHNFYDVLLIKAGLQISYLIDKAYLTEEAASLKQYPERIARDCYQFVKDVLTTTRPIIERLSTQHKLVLVSNFYGNIETILKDFGLLCLFKGIVESSVVGVRKPDPAIFELGVSALGVLPHEAVVIGDSFSKDMIPAAKVGCKTIWLKGKGWEEETDERLVDVVVHNLSEIPEVFA